VPDRVDPDRADPERVDPNRPEPDLDVVLVLVPEPLPPPDREPRPLVPRALPPLPVLPREPPALPRWPVGRLPPGGTFGRMTSTGSSL
jgi:hypothetical protein